MPLFLTIRNDSFQLTIWHITEANKYKNFRFQQSAMAREALKIILPNKDVNIKKINNKPYLQKSNSYISFSHSQNWAIAGYSKFNIGVDIQVFNKKIIDIKNRFLHPDEEKYLMNLDIKKLSIIWAIKEATYKCSDLQPLYFMKNYIIDPHTILNLENTKDSVLYHSNIKVIEPNGEKTYQVYYSQYENFVLAVACLIK